MQRLRARMLLAVAMVAAGAGSRARATDAPDVVAALDANGDGRLRVVCLGDSNTASGWAMPAAYGWCERLQALAADPRVTTVTRGFGGATVTALRVDVPGLGRIDAGPQLAMALAEDAPDVVILAYGTNDLAFRRTSARIVAAYRARRRSARARGVRALVALAPPAFPPASYDTTAVERLNRRILVRVPREHVIDFASGMTSADYLADGVHLDESGQRKRAAAAWEAIRCLALPGRAEQRRCRPHASW